MNQLYFCDSCGKPCLDQFNVQTYFTDIVEHYCSVECLIYNHYSDDDRKNVLSFLDKTDDRLQTLCNEIEDQIDDEVVEFVDINDELQEIRHIVDDIYAKVENRWPGSF